MKRAIVASLVLTALFTILGVATAQTRPDFSGSWTAESAPDVPAPQMPATGEKRADGLPVPPPPPPPPSTVAMSIRHTDGELAIERTLTSQNAAVLPRVAYKLDGTESVNSNAVMTLKTTAAWEGSSLVLSTVHSFDGKPVGSSKETYRLDGKRLIVERTLNTPRGTINGTQVFVKND
jgi:hypothetical protein